VSKAMAREAAEVAARRAAVAAQADAPPSIHSVPVDASDVVGKSSAFIRPLGNSRRVFLLDPYMKADEMEGLAYRIKVLSHNEGINSILIATDDRDDAANFCLPTYLQTYDEPNLNGLSATLEPNPGHTWHVAGGYDPLRVAEEKDEAEIQKLMESISKLSAATQGRQYATDNELPSKIPIITMPHGAVTDAGYALCMGSYVLATPETCFKISNPSRGLSFDPVGFSYLLPRLGFDGYQRSSKFKGCGMILALTGYEANCYDMVETGLATHLVSGAMALPFLERNLAAIPPYSLQKLVQKPKHFYGHAPPPDANAKMRNVAVAHTIENISQYAADSSNSVPLDYFGLRQEDPALDTDHVPWDSAFFSSDLVDYGQTFDAIFSQEKSVEGLMERLREVGARQTDNLEEQECSAVAKELVERMERQSPLALRVIFQLMTIGAGRQANFEECMKREQAAQLKMLRKDDFQNWAKHCRKNGLDKAEDFAGWKHESVTAVTADEVAEIIN
jgi:enoyl-CoA hydratase/carnithine racemase